MLRTRWFLPAAAAALVVSTTGLPGGGAVGGTVATVGGAAEVSATATPARLTACPTWAAPVSSSGVTAAPLTELSGLAPAASPGEWWTHNDSGDSPRIFRVDGDLRVVAEVTLDVPFVLDAEDVAIGADGRVWLADIGDNFALRPAVALFGIEPPAGSGTVSPRTVTLVYPGGPRDAETLLIDPISGDAFVVAKAVVAGRAEVYRVAASVLAAAAGVSTMELVTTIDVTDGGPVGPTAGDISASGSYVAVTTPSTTYVWLRSRGQTVAEVLTASPAAPCRVTGAGATEALAFSADGRALVSVLEGTGRPLLTITRTAP